MIFIVFYSDRSRRAPWLCARDPQWLDDSGWLPGRLYRR